MSRPKGTGCVYQRGTVWWLKYSRYGRAYRESTHSTDKRKAEKMLKVRLAEITSGTFVGPQAERVRVEELADDLLREYRINGRKSMDDVETRWKLHLKPFFGVMRAVDVTSEMIARYVDSRQRQEAKKRNNQPGISSPQTDVPPWTEGNTRQGPARSRFSSPERKQRPEGIP